MCLPEESPRRTSSRLRGRGTHLFLVIAHGRHSAAQRTSGSSADSARGQSLYVGVARVLSLSPVTSGHPCPTGPPTDSSFSSLRVPMGQIQKKGFCGLIFSIAEGSVVQKSSRLSHPPNLGRPHVTHTHTHTHTQTHTTESL
ncbi:hypothetical protein mRhiFer1_009320 [Rhinolophus ferrumequinum]|uniref:Uncharacterized protein n=1 Tax=Rhinolophus ferrumequinum TaxID=59479 RepID=A0A7J7RXS7_RHIFE|nr:hypothetical protein mRhiFer1_009320 [Rhinolophus ferrumequinum]